MTVMLDDAELFQVSRHARLRRRHAAAFEQGPQVFLRANRLGPNQVQYFLLPRSLIHNYMQTACINIA